MLNRKRTIDERFEALAWLRIITIDGLSIAGIEDARNNIRDFLKKIDNKK